MAFFLAKQYYGPFSAQTYSIRSKKRQFFAKFFGENVFEILKVFLAIITLVPGCCALSTTTATLPFDSS
jgi:hypothetical protein